MYVIGSMFNKDINKVERLNISENCYEVMPEISQLEVPESLSSVFMKNEL